MATHYNIAVIPTRVRRPRDKAKVENAVLQVERRIIAALRNRTFFREILSIVVFKVFSNVSLFFIFMPPLSLCLPSHHQ
jgi:hypothetical protein